MTSTDDRWSGTSDSRAVIAARLQSTPTERLAWLGDSLELLVATGALPRLREERQRESDAWWAATDGHQPQP